MKSKGRYQKESRKIYRKNQKKKKKTRERLQKEKEREEKVTVSIPIDRVEDVNIGEDGYGNEWVFFKRNRRDDYDDDDHRRSRNNNASSSSYKRRRSPNYWSPEEEENLKIAVWKYSKNGGKSASWVEIMEKEGQYFQGRTAEDLKDKWRNMTKPPVEGKTRRNCT